MSAHQKFRIKRIQDMMAQEGFAAIICRLPENVVYLTDYWPHHGFSVAVLAQDGDPYIFVPEVETKYANEGWARVEEFGWGLLRDGDLYTNYRLWLKKMREKLGLKGKIVGVEKNFEVTAPTYRAAEPVVPAVPWRNLLEEVFVDSTIKDIHNLISSARAVKGEYELEKLRLANEIAEMGINYALEKIEPGLSEAEIGAWVEYKIRADGPGYKGARLVRAFAEVAAGKVGSTRANLLIPSTSYKTQEGDWVLIEVATVVDGYWSDLTYMAVVGKPNDRQKEVYNILLEAQQAAAFAMRAGGAFCDPDHAAREILKKAGLEKYFVHITGHGVGFRYHEFIPFLMPDAQDVLEKGMVSSVEPGIYMPEFGGIRIEDNVAVGENGPIFLSTPRKPW